MTQRVILHVGPHKTGSTALQHEFSANRERLSLRGILIPRNGLVAHGHHLLAAYCHGEDRGFSQQAFTSEIQGQETVLISTENSVTLSLAGLRTLRELFPKAEFQVVYYLRNLCDLWPSHWQEMVKHGQTLTLPEYIVAAANGVPENGWSAANQLDQLSKLQDVFGVKALTIFSYDRILAEGRDIATEFFDRVLDISSDALPIRSGPQNSRLEPWQIELVRIQNVIHLQRFDEFANGSLRADIFDLINSGRPEWIETFRTAAKRATEIRLNSEGPLIDALQRELVERFATCFADPDSEHHYLKPRLNRVLQVDIPWAAEAALWQKMVELNSQLAPEPVRRRPEKFSAD